MAVTSHVLFQQIANSNNPGAVVPTILLLLIIAPFWAVYGISINVKKIYASVVLTFVLITLSFYLPNTFEAIEAVTKGGKETVDSIIAECIKSPGRCMTDISKPLAAMGILEWAIVLGTLWIGGGILALATNYRAISRITTRLTFIILFLLLLNWLIWGSGLGWFKGVVSTQPVYSTGKSDRLWRAAKDDSPVDLVRSYFGDVNRHDVVSAIEKWKDPNRTRLASMMNRVEWFRVNNLELRTDGLYSAQVGIEITGKNLEAIRKLNLPGLMVY
jgi:hypothetical protein